MVIEALPQIWAGPGVATEEGRSMHRLVVIDDGLRRHEDPDAPYSMSPEMVESHTAIREKEIKNLGIQKGEEQAEISRIRNYLEQEGAPFHRALEPMPHPFGVLTEEAPRE